MKIRHVWAVWFSATGTTEKVVTTAAKRLAGLLDAAYREYAFTLPDARKKELCFQEEDLAVCGLPVYAGRLPNLIMPYVRDRIHGKKTPAVPVVLYGNRNFDDALIELRDLMHANGFCPVSAGAFVGEHAFSRVLGAGRPDEEDLSLAEKLAEKTAEKIKSLPGLPDQPVAVEGCDPIRPYYTPRDRDGNPTVFLKAKPRTDPDKCTDCGICAKVCPMGSIDAEHASEISGKCIKCCACVKKCPEGAKYFDDDPFLRHKAQLEETYGSIRAESRLFL